MSTALLFNHSQFFLAINTLPASAFTIQQITGSDDGISCHYVFQIQCISDTFYSPAQVIRQRAILSWLDDAHCKYYRHGWINQVSYLGQQAIGHCYRFQCTSLLAPLVQRYQLRSWIRQTLTSIISSIFEKAGLPKTYFSFQLQQGDKHLAYMVQYAQTDWQLLQTLLQTYGWQFIWQQDQLRARLIITDQLNNLDFPNITVKPVLGTNVQHESNMIRQEPFLTLVTNNRNLYPGQCVHFSEKTYRIACIAHEVLQNTTAPWKDNALRYAARLWLIDSTLSQYIVHPQHQRQRTPLFSMKTEATEGDYAYLDSTGCYLSRLPFDEINTVTQASPPQRLTQSHYCHFPVRANTEIAVTHLDGNIHQPLIVGTIANPDTTTPVTATNPDHYLMRTWASHQLVFIDQPEQPKITMATARQQNYLHLNAMTTQPQLTLQSQQGAINFFSTKQCFMQTMAHHYQIVKQSHQTTVNHQQTFQTQQTNHWQAGNSIVLNAKQTIQCQSITQAIAIQVYQTQLQSPCIMLQSQFNTIQLTSQQSLQLYTQQLMAKANQGIQLIGNGNAITAQSTGLNIQTPMLIVNAATIHCPEPS